MRSCDPGKKKVPFGSNVAARGFYNPLEALTLRGRRIDFTAAN